MADKKLLVLVDGSSYLFRAFHALPPLTNSSGQPTGAVVGVINMLRKLVADENPDYIGVVFDAPGKTFRDKIYAEYKAHRPPMPDDLRDQIEPLHAIIRAMGMPLVIEPNVEADDVIGTLAVEAQKAGMKILVSTSDKDLAQLVNDDITLVNTMSDTVTDRDGVVDRFGVRADQIIDYLALVGDSSDNIPGVQKCGPKTAAKWLAEYDNIDNLVEHADDIKGKIGEYLREAIGNGQLEMSRDLTRIRTDLELHEKPGDLLQAEPDVPELRTWYEKLEANRLLATLQESSPVEAAIPEPAADADYETVLERERLDAWIKKLGKAKLVTFDTETTSLDYMQAELVGLSFSVREGEACYIPVGHRGPDAPAQLDREEVLSALKPILEDPEKPKLGQHLKYDMNVLANYAVHVEGVVFDTMLESYVYNSVATRHDMDSLAKAYLDYSTIKFEEIAGKGAKQLTFDQIPLEQMNTSMTINATAPWLLALYVAVAEEQGADISKLQGTVQNDIIKEYLSRGTYISPPQPSLRMITDVAAWTREHCPKWNPMNVCSYHLQEAGATPEQELAYALATAIAVLDDVRPKVPEEAFPAMVGRISFFVNAGIRFVTEVCKMRAFTELWDEICRERYGVEDPKFRRFRYGVQVNSLGLTEQQPENNVTRILIEMLAVTLSKNARARAVQLPAWNEALGLPRPWDQQWSLTMQQVLAYETDLLEYDDLFDGNPAVEAKVSALKDGARAELAQIDAMCGAVGAIESDLASATKGLADVRQTLAGLLRTKGEH